MKPEYAIIVKNKTRLEALKERFNTKLQAKFYIETQGGNFEDYEHEDDVFHESLHKLQAQLSNVIKHKMVERSFLPSYLFSEKNLIVVIGQDGLVANTAKYSQGIPMVAVNPDPERYDGVLLPYTVADFLGGVEDVMAGQYHKQVMNFAEARLNDGQRLLAFNDLFIGASSHISARYRISYEGQSEEQSSSGVIVSTAVGATGWISSVFNMAYGVTGFFDKSIQSKRPVLTDRLLFAVREPFKSIRTQTDVVIGLISNSQPLLIESFMPSNGVIFSDGIESDFLRFNSGATVTIGISGETATLVKPR
jgi:NAD kinase